jgi:Brp/Blh family beta-carotene 15,15'-monooxygenase
MTKYSNISIVASFFGLWVDSFFSNQIQIILGFTLIFTFGILHGANDLLLIEKISSQKKQTSYLKRMGYYICVVLIGAFLFYLVPWLALLLFILISAYHFGEQQWHDLIHYFPKWISVLFPFTYGLLILFLLFNFHIKEVQNIVLEITSISIPSLYISLSLKIFGGIFILISAYFYWKTEAMKKKLLTELFYLFVFAIIFKSSSLIWGFAIYFILWHSIPSIIDQITFLKGKYSLHHFMVYCRSAAPYWLVSLLGITILSFVFKEKQLFNALFFSFLAAITFPHAIVIMKMFQQNKMN